jgi:DNA-binding NarL/FixJ family response regulator
MNGGPERSSDSVTAVLICDDSPQLRMLLSRIIGQVPALQVVGEAADGREAIIEATRLQPDVILLDLSMPVLSGLDALPDLRRVAPSSKIIILSGLPAATVSDRALALGAHHYIEKGAGAEAIIAAIHEATADGTDGTTTA